MNELLNSKFWSDRYRSNETGWDLGGVSGPLLAYFDQLSDTSVEILIPGCGNAYEAEYLIKKGFDHVHVVDLAEEPLNNFRRRLGDPDYAHCHVGDFFDHEGEYDLIIEQTFFCAIDPKLREEYAKKTSSLLKPGGKLVGVLFSVQMESGPPFGGLIEEYEALFSKYFRKVEIEPCYNSISPRKDRECFVKLSV